MITLSRTSLLCCLVMLVVGSTRSVLAQTQAQSPTPSAAIPAQSGSLNKLSVGIYGGVAYNMHRGTLTTNEGVLECGTFESTSSLRWFAGNQVNIPLNDDWAFSPRLYYHKANGSFEAGNPVQPLIALKDGSTTTLTTQHTLDVALDYLSVDILAEYFLTNRIYAVGGVTVGIPTRNAFEQNETIVTPVGTTFLDGSTSRRIAAGYFSDSKGNVAGNNLRLAAVAGLGMIIPLSTSFSLNPEVSFQYGITNVITDASWVVHSLRAGAGLLYILGPAAEPPPPPPPPLPPATIAVVPVAPAMASLDVHNVLQSGTVENYAEVIVHDHRTLDILPLLPYVFFDEKSSQLLDRYKSSSSADVSNFSENSLPNDQLAVYHDILNIIGSRMKRYPDAKLSLVGCLDPSDDGAVKGLSSSRAEAVRSYLRSTWGISDNRISLSSRQLPEIVSTRNIADGRSENMRVEISSNDERILAPVYARNARRSYDPPTLRLTPTVAYQGKIASTTCKILDANGRVLATKQATGTESVDFDVNSLGLADVKTNQPLTAVFEVTTDSAKTVHTERTIPLRRTFTSARANSQIVKDTVVERYSMILFNFDRASTIAGSDEQVLRLVRSRVRTSSTVNIEGMTDYIGANKNNQILSEARANAVRNDISSRIKPEFLNTKGLGEVDLFDNKIPEGRFYNRRVFVEIETPLHPELDDEGGTP